MARSVFLSSTFSDFIKERKLLLETIPFIDIHVNCAERKGKSGKSLKKTIEDWIDSSDMVVLLISDKYGTEPNLKHSWTQKEFEYAKEKNKEIFAYIRAIPENKKQFVDNDLEKRDKLKNFIELVEEYVKVVPRYEFGEDHQLVAMVIRDLERHQKELDQKESEKIYRDGFTG